VLIAVQKDGLSLQFASDRLKDDKAIVLTAVNQNGRSLEYASDRLKDNEEIVLSAVKRDGTALQYASERIKNDKEIVKKIIEIDPVSFIHVNKKVKDDKEIVLSVLNKDLSLFKYVGNKLRGDIEFCIICSKIDNISSLNNLQFIGEAKKIFQAHNNDIVAVETAYRQQQVEKEQQQANKIFLQKIKKTKDNSTPELFKRNLLNV
jgi:CxxC motif-containing protein